MESRHPTAVRAACALIFFVNGFAFASWIPHLPAVKVRLGIGAGMLGLALLGVAVGALVSMPLAGTLISRWGSRPVTLVSSVLFCALVALPVRATSLPLLVLALVAFGAANGAMDVAMNAQGVAVEKRLGKPIMSALHAWFSIGGLVGAGSATLILSRDLLSPQLHMGGLARWVCCWWGSHHARCCRHRPSRPVLFSAAGRTPSSSPGMAIASVATVGYGGFLAGPPLVGFAADWVGLPLALGLLAAFMALIAAEAWRGRLWRAA